MKIRPEIIFVVVLLVLILFSGVSLLSSTPSLPKLQINFPKLVLPDPSNAIKTSTSTSNSISITPTTTPTIITSPTKKVTPIPTKIIKRTTTTPTPTRACYRFQFVDFNAESSNLCYSKSDYDQLVELKADYDAALLFYNFHMKGADQYQKLYDESGSKIYLDAKASSLKQAEEQQRRMDDTSREMYKIKQRGF